MSVCLECVIAERDALKAENAAIKSELAEARKHAEAFATLHDKGMQDLEALKTETERLRMELVTLLPASVAFLQAARKYFDEEIHWRKGNAASCKPAFDKAYAARIAERDET